MKDYLHFIFMNPLGTKIHLGLEVVFSIQNAQ